jgi:hypothetical protein
LSVPVSNQQSAVSPWIQQLANSRLQPAQLKPARKPKSKSLMVRLNLIALAQELLQPIAICRLLFAARLSAECWGLNADG